MVKENGNGDLEMILTKIWTEKKNIVYENTSEQETVDGLPTTHWLFYIMCY